MILLICSTYSCQTHTERKQNGDYQEMGGGIEGNYFMGRELQICKTKLFHNNDVSILNTSELCTLKKWLRG